MEAKHQIALEKAMERLRQVCPELRAVFFGGSVSRGEGSATSDLDLYCIADIDHRVRHTWIEEGIYVEVFLNPYPQILKYFEQDDAVAMHLIKTGKLIYGDENDPVIKKIRELAGKEHDEGPRPYSGFMLNLMRYMSLDGYEDVTDVADDEGLRRWAGFDVLAKAIEFHYSYNGRWMQKPKRLLNDLVKWNPGLEQKIREYMETGAVALLQEMLEEIYAPLGGLERFEYSSAPDYSTPLPEVEIVLIRHGWPHKDKDLPADEWVLDYTAYLELARYIELPEIQGIERIYTSPQIKAKQTASFYFAQLADCGDMQKVAELAEARRSGQYYENYNEVIEAYLRGEKTEEGWEEFAEVEKRVMGAVAKIAKEARYQRKRKVAVVGHGLLFMALKKQVCGLTDAEVLANWSAIPFGPYARLRVDAFGEVSWLGEVLVQEE